MQASKRAVAGEACLRAQGDAHNAAELVHASLQLLQGLHVFVEVQLLGHGLRLNRAAPAAWQAANSATCVLSQDVNGVAVSVGQDQTAPISTWLWLIWFLYTTEGWHRKQGFGCKAAHLNLAHLIGLLSWTGMGTPADSKGPSACRTFQNDHRWRHIRCPSSLNAKIRTSTYMFRISTSRTTACLS